MQRKAKITQRLNKDGSVSVVYRGRVIFKHQDPIAIKIYLDAFLGANQ